MDVKTLIRFSRKIITSFVLLSAVGSNCFADFLGAMEIYQEGRYAEAQQAFEALAAIGDRASLFNLGVMHYRGEIGEADTVKALALMKIANDGYDNEVFTKTINSISKQLTDLQKQQVDKAFEELNLIHNIQAVLANIFPKPLDDEDCVPQRKPIKKYVPKYPLKEQGKGLMGVTILEFTVSPEGYVRDVETISSVSEGFTETSIDAIKHNFYEPSDNRRPDYGGRMIYTYSIEKGKKSKVRTKRLSKELNKLEAAANQGDPIAQYQYGHQLNVYKQFESYLKDIDLQYRTANDWFMKSAQAGLPHAQYVIGRNMIQGRGCEVDKVNGYKWVSVAAVAGYSPAQEMMARKALNEQDATNQKANAAMSWLRNAAMSLDNYSAKLLLSWELSTSADSSLRNGKEALALLKQKPNNYYDEVRIFETKAAAYAELGDFKNALVFQKKAAREAKKLDWTIPKLEERLALYQHSEPFRGEYY